MRSVDDIRADLDKLSTTAREGWTRTGDADERAAARRLAGDVEPLLYELARTEVMLREYMLVGSVDDLAAMKAEVDRLSHIVETLTVANGARERRALRAEAEVRRQDEALVRLGDSSRTLRAENERLRAALGSVPPASTADGVAGADDEEHEAEQREDHADDPQDVQVEDPAEDDQHDSEDQHDLVVPVRDRPGGEGR
jgi:hypothetical protein